jgi:hypothetical protein
MVRKDGTPETMEELENYLEEYADVIFVREQIDGRWGSYSLAELPTELSEKHKDRFLSEGFIPVRLKREHEIENV